VQRETAAPSVFEKETGSERLLRLISKAACNGVCFGYGIVFVCVSLFVRVSFLGTRIFFIESAGSPHRVGAGNGPASLFGKETAEHAAWMAVLFVLPPFLRRRKNEKKERRT
jgi:hypothetical protein